VALEIFPELPDVRTLVVPVGGGGLIGGSAWWRARSAPAPASSARRRRRPGAMHASLAAGSLCCPPQGATLCEGLSGETDERSLALAREVVDEVVLVSEAAVRRAMRWLFVEEGVVAEGSAAVAAAALLEGAVDRLAGPAVVVLTGSNVDAARLADVLGSE
jgi:threonine dehydratase